MTEPKIEVDNLPEFILNLYKEIETKYKDEPEILYSEQLSLKRIKYIFKKMVHTKPFYFIHKFTWKHDVYGWVVDTRQITCHIQYCEEGATGEFYLEFLEDYRFDRIGTLTPDIMEELLFDDIERSNINE